MAFHGMIDAALSIAQEGNKIILGWPTSLGTNAVQTAETLSPPIQWRPLTNAPVASGNQYILVLDMIESSQFFGLTNSSGR